MEQENVLNSKELGVPEHEKRQRYLENEIHKVSLKMMEGDMVRKKYDVILDMLKKEQMHYSRQSKQLEVLITNQIKETGKIQEKYYKHKKNPDFRSP